MGKSSKRILFVCIENAGRSQMAEAFAKQHGLDAQSAGTMPGVRINPTVVEAMKEKGIRLSSCVPKKLTPEMVEKAKLVVREQNGILVLCSLDGRTMQGFPVIGC